ncbi:MAG: 5-oxoprolinase subunit PxpB [Phycisphaerales bacterium JB060]
MATADQARIEWTSERSLCVRADAPPHVVAGVLRPMPGVRDAVATEHAVWVTLDGPGEAIERSIQRCLVEGQRRAGSEPRMHEIAVCYEGKHAPDLGEVASHAGMPEREVIETHTGTEFSVAFIGFAPGFGYLAGLPERLHVPRLASPRTRVPAGSVGVAGPYSGVYGLPGPGGWRIIGRTNAVMFGVERSEPTLLRAGDVVRFRAVTEREFGA